MKSKHLYIILVVFITLIFIIFLINIWLSSQIEEKIKPEKKEITPQETMIDTPSISFEQISQSVSKATSRPAITVIKRPQKEKIEPVLKERTEERQRPIKSSSSASQGSSLSGRANDNGLSDESASGITKINKHPSEIESKEMNEKGIVIW
jgi:hypothetical protein